MGWGKFSSGAASVVRLAFLGFQNGFTLISALGLGLLTGLAIRVTLQWLGRTRHYLRKGRSSDRATCPNCVQSRRRLPGDLVLECKHCGWQPGFPGLRYLTHSVASYQLRRSLSGSRVVLGGLCVIAILYGGVLTSFAGPVGLAGFADDGMKQGEYKTSPVSETVTTTPTKTPASSGRLIAGYNMDVVELEFISLLNQERESRGLQEVSQRDVLSELGQSHAQVMANIDELTHTQPDGTTIEDRYQQRGLLPECELPIQGTERFYPGAENAYQGYIDTQVSQADGGVITVHDEQSLAKAMFESWMSSKPHREAMLVYSADQAGLGVARVEGTDKIYAALELC